MESELDSKQKQGQIQMTRRRFISGLAEKIGMGAGVVIGRHPIGKFSEGLAGIPSNPVDAVSQTEQEQPPSFAMFKNSLSRLINESVDTWPDAVQIYRESVGILQRSDSIPVGIDRVTFKREVLDEEGGSSLLSFKIYPEGENRAPRFSSDSDYDMNPSLEVPKKIRLFGAEIENQITETNLPPDFGQGIDGITNLSGVDIVTRGELKESVVVRLNEDGSHLVVHNHNYRMYLDGVEAGLSLGVSRFIEQNGQARTEFSYSLTDSSGNIIGSYPDVFSENPEKNPNVESILASMHEAALPVFDQTSAQN